MVELEEFLESIDVALRGSVQDPVTPLLAKWENRFPGKTTDTMITWNNVLDDRNLMITRLEGQTTVSAGQLAMDEQQWQQKKQVSNFFLFFKSPIVFESAGEGGDKTLHQQLRAKGLRCA